MLDQLHTIRIMRQLVVGSCLLLLAAGCSSTRPSAQEEISEKDSQMEKKLLLSEYEATLNPADFDQEIEVVEKAHMEERKEQAPLEIPKDTLIVEEEIIQGFRIQVFSSSNLDDATLMKIVTQEKFISDSVYVVYDPPVYKVRVGDFINRYEASQRLPEFVDSGYRDAWVVPDRIIQRKFVRAPLPR